MSYAEIICGFGIGLKVVDERILTTDKQYDGMQYIEKIAEMLFATKVICNSRMNSRFIILKLRDIIAVDMPQHAVLIELKKERRENSHTD